MRDEAEARGRGAQGVERQVRAVFLQQHHQAPDVTAPEAGGLITLGAARIDGEAVVNEDQGPWSAQRFDVDEITQRELEVMHAIDERHLQWPPTQERGHVGAGEELITGLREDPLVRRQCESHPRLRVDAQRECLWCYELQRFATGHADFQVGRRTHVLVHARQKLEIVFGGQFQLRQQSISLGVVTVAQRPAAQTLRVGPAPQPLIQACAKEAVARPAAQAGRLGGTVDPGFSHCDCSMSVPRFSQARCITPPFSLSPEPLAIGTESEAGAARPRSW